MDVVELVGRVVFAAIFLDYGSTHLRQRTGMIAFAQSFGAPMPHITVPLSGAMMVLGGLAIALGVWPDVGAILLVLFLVPAAFVAHSYWKETDFAMRGAQRSQFWKNVSLTGAAIYIFGTAVSAGEDMPLTLVGPLF
jgi:putative oxidoreductase